MTHGALERLARSKQRQFAPRLMATATITKRAAVRNSLFMAVILNHPLIHNRLVPSLVPLGRLAAGFFGVWDGCAREGRSPVRVRAAGSGVAGFCKRIGRPADLSLLPVLGVAFMR